MAGADGLLMIELDEDDRAVDAVVEHAAGIGPADPREPGAIEMGADFGHLHPRVPVVHGADVEPNQLQQLFLL